MVALYHTFDTSKFVNRIIAIIDLAEHTLSTIQRCSKKYEVKKLSRTLKNRLKKVPVEFR